VNRCEKCNLLVWEMEMDGDGFWGPGEWHHIRNTAGERCDCPENGQVLCTSCHREGHPRTMSGKVSA
jgi:hypothetical protein